MHIYHVTPSYDPIFSANEPRYYEGLQRPYYYNADPRARPLACVDTSELCSPDGKTCWSMRDPVPPGIPSTPAYWLMKLSLENSNIHEALQWRLGSALLAQQSLSQYLSTGLDPNQWEIEASQLFATSLARIQYEAWQIATGEDRGKPGYFDNTPVEAKGFLCGLYKLKATDHTNVNLAAFIGLILLAIVIFLLSLEINVSGKGTTSNKRPSSSSSKPLVVGTIIQSVCLLLIELVKLAHEGIGFLYRKVRYWIQGRETGRVVLE